MVRRHQHVGTEHLVRFARERLPHAVGEEGDTGYAANGEHEPERKHAQLPRASVAQEHAEGETQHAFSPRRRSGRRRAGFSGDSVCGRDAGDWGFDSEGVCRMGPVMWCGRSRPRRFISNE